jgi:hypothetical protein
MYRSPEPAVSHAATLLTLRDPEGEDDPGTGVVSVAVEAGGEVRLLAKVRNQGEIVDNFRLRVEGVPDGWWTTAPETVFLNPWGTEGEYEQEVQVRLRPPLSPEAEAREWPIRVIAHSRALDADVVFAPAVLHVNSFQRTSLRVAPERRAGLRRASFDVTVANQGNSPVEIAINAEDAERRCPIEIAPKSATVPVGEAIAVRLKVAVPYPVIFGRPLDHQLQVTHLVNGASAEQAPQRATFRQRPWLPWWVPPVVLLIAAVVAAIHWLRPEGRIPDLGGDTLDEATAEIARHRLRLGDVTYVVASKDARTNTVFRQTPKAGADAAKGETVNIELATPPKSTVVPNVNDETLGAAISALAGAHLTYAPSDPSAANDWKVLRQSPAAGETAEYDTPVELAVQAPAPTPAKTSTPTPTPTPTASPTRTPRRGPKPTPTPTTKPAAKPTAKPAAKPAAKPSVPVRRPSDFIYASATSGVLFAWPRNERKPRRLTSPQYALRSPARTEDGYVAVQLDGVHRRLVTITADGKTVTPLTETGAFFRPTYSRDRGLVAVIAATRKPGPADAGELCVADPQVHEPPTCVARKAVRLGRPSWSPDGRHLLALGATRTRGYTRLLDFSAVGRDPARWSTTPIDTGKHLRIESATWVGTDRIAVLVVTRKWSSPHLRLLSRRHDGTFTVTKDFTRQTGCELAAVRHYLALRKGSCAARDGVIRLLDANRSDPQIRELTSGINPTWAE